MNLRSPLFPFGVALALGTIACASPEAKRTRGGGPGADLGNRGAVVEMHGGSVIYYATPCLITGDKCTEPLPQSEAPKDRPEPKANERKS